MANKMIRNMAVGSSVKARISGGDYNFIIVNQGLPSSGDYDSSCNGTWLMVESCLNKVKYSTNSQLYASSNAKDWLENSLYGALENGLRGVIKTVKIPYSYSTTEVRTGSSGLETRIFLPSATELGFEANGENNQEGAALPYFSSDDKRIGKYNGTDTVWATRTPNTVKSSDIITVNTDGTKTSGDYTLDYGMRPIVIIYDTCYVDDEGNLIPDFAPTITSTFATNGSDIGTKTDYFTFTYTVTTARSDLTLAVDEVLSGDNVSKTKTTIYPTSGKQRTFSISVDNHEDFYKLLNGKMTLTVKAYYSDYDNAAVNTVTEYYITFTKDVKGAAITLKTPMSVSGAITKGIITLAGDIPDDGLTVEVTRNAKNGSPSWQDISYYVKNKTEFNFTSTSGSDFNFRVTLNRGTTDSPCFISTIVGAFE